MGEARRRGSFEERKKQSIERQEAEDALRFKRYQERMSQPTRKKGKALLALAIAASTCMVVPRDSGK